MAKEEEVLEALRGVLQDPEAVQKLSAMAGSLLGGSEPAEEAPTVAVTPSVGGLDLSRLGDERQMHLLEALEPYLSPQRRETAHRLMQLLRLLRLAEGAKSLKEGR